MITNGKLSIDKNFKITDQPVCEEIRENMIKYKINVLLENLMAVYDWKISNLFGKEFSESLILKVE